MTSSSSFHLPFTVKLLQFNSMKVVAPKLLVILYFKYSFIKCNFNQVDY